MFSKAPRPFKQGGVMIGDIPDRFINLIGLLGNDEQRLLLVPFINKMQNLSGGKLEYNRVKGLIPVEQSSRNQKNNHIGRKNIVPCIYSVFF